LVPRASFVIAGCTTGEDEVQKFSRIRVHNTLVLPIILYGSEIWTLRKNGRKCLTSIKMKFLKRKARYIPLDHKRKKEIWKRLK
jgi:hypothetical protein